VIPAVKGTLEETSFPVLIRPIVRGGRTGVLRVTRGKITKTVYISQGRLIFATSTDPDDRLGEMLLKRGLITYKILEDSVRAIQVGKRQGTILVESGAIRSRHLVEGVLEQVQEIIYSLFAFEEGEYEFVEGELPSREVIVLRMSTADILLEGSRRVQGWKLIRAGVGGLDQQYALSPEATVLGSGMSLLKEEMDLLASMDGVLTLEEICSQTRRNDFLVCRTVWGFWAAGLLDRIPQDREYPAGPQDKTEPHAEGLRGASIGREIDRFNELHRFIFELVTYELRDQAGGFFERAFARVLGERADLFEGVPVDGTGELDPIALRQNIATKEIATFVRGLDRLLEIEGELIREILGERKAAIIVDGLLCLKERQLEGKPLGT
jgi:hypothetical protein